VQRSLSFKCIPLWEGYKTTSQSRRIPKWKILSTIREDINFKLRDPIYDDSDVTENLKIFVHIITLILKPYSGSNILLNTPIKSLFPH
jgi:hypothetical protein